MRVLSASALADTTSQTLRWPQQCVVAQPLRSRESADPLADLRPRTSSRQL